MEAEVQDRHIARALLHVTMYIVGTGLFEQDGKTVGVAVVWQWWCCLSEALRSKWESSFDPCRLAADRNGRPKVKEKPGGAPSLLKTVTIQPQMQR